MAKEVKKITEADFLVDYRYYQTLDVSQGEIVPPGEGLIDAWETPDEINETALDEYFAPAYIEVLHIALLLSSPSGKTLWEAKAHKMLDVEDPDDETLKAILLPATRKMLARLPSARR